MNVLYGIAMATCARKALHVVFEKSAAIHYREVERSYLATAEYRRLNPAGLVPTLSLASGDVLVESSIIMRFIDEAFAGPSLQPTSPLARARMNLWMKWMDERYFPASSAITIATYIRSLLGQPLEETRLQAMLASLTDPAQRALREEAVRARLAAPSVQAAVRTLGDLLYRMEEALQETAWLAGPDCSLADSAVMPLILRLEELGLDAGWATLPAVSAWWQRLKQRPATQRIIAMAHEPMRRQLHESATDIRPELLAALIQR